MGVFMVQVELLDVDEYGTGCGCMIPYAVIPSKEISGLARTPSQHPPLDPPSPAPLAKFIDIAKKAGID